jgi:hypothetical protein
MIAVLNVVSDTEFHGFRELLLTDRNRQKGYTDHVIQYQRVNHWGLNVRVLEV